MAGLWINGCNVATWLLLHNFVADGLLLAGVVDRVAHVQKRTWSQSLSLVPRYKGSRIARLVPNEQRRKPHADVDILTTMPTRAEPTWKCIDIP